MADENFLAKEFEIGGRKIPVWGVLLGVGAAVVALFVLRPSPSSAPAVASPPASGGTTDQGGAVGGGTGGVTAQDLADALGQVTQAVTAQQTGFAQSVSEALQQQQRQQARFEGAFTQKTQEAINAEQATLQSELSKTIAGIQSYTPPVDAMHAPYQGVPTAQEQKPVILEVPSTASNQNTFSLAGILPKVQPSPQPTPLPSSTVAAQNPELAYTRAYQQTQLGYANATVGGRASAYTVVSGDTLSRIARTAGVSLSKLIAANPQIANPNLIRVGQVVNVPT